jgi:hypothetical protein
LFLNASGLIGQGCAGNKPSVPAYRLREASFSLTEEA